MKEANHGSRFHSFRPSRGRGAAFGDLPTNCYVEHKAISFKYAVPSLEEFTGRIKTIARRGAISILQNFLFLKG